MPNSSPNWSMILELVIKGFVESFVYLQELSNECVRCMVSKTLILSQIEL